jgi:hypothetical protein
MNQERNSEGKNWETYLKNRVKIVSIPVISDETKDSQPNVGLHRIATIKGQTFLGRQREEHWLQQERSSQRNAQIQVRPLQTKYMYMYNMNPHPQHRIH